MKWDEGNPTGHGIIFIGTGGQVYCYVTPGGVRPIGLWARAVRSNDLQGRQELRPVVYQPHAGGRRGLLSVLWGSLVGGNSQLETRLGLENGRDRGRRPRGAQSGGAAGSGAKSGCDCDIGPSITGDCEGAGSGAGNIRHVGIEHGTWHGQKQLIRRSANLCACHRDRSDCQNKDDEDTL